MCVVFSDSLRIEGFPRSETVYLDSIPGSPPIVIPDVELTEVMQLREEENTTEFETESDDINQVHTILPEILEGLNLCDLPLFVFCCFIFANCKIETHT